MDKIIWNGRQYHRGGDGGWIDAKTGKEPTPFESAQINAYVHDVLAHPGKYVRKSDSVSPPRRFCNHNREADLIVGLRAYLDQDHWVIPEEALTRECCWRELCRIRGKHVWFDGKPWAAICAFRKELLDDERVKPLTKQDDSAPNWI